MAAAVGLCPLTRKRNVKRRVKRKRSESMKIKRNLIITAICFLGVFCLATMYMALTRVPAEASQAPLVKTEKEGIEWEGFISDQSEELVTVITGNEAWLAIWDTAFHEPPPVVDFNNYAVACVFLGFRAPWAFNIEFGAPFVEGDKLIIRYYLTPLILELSGPFRASGQYHMKVFKKKKGYTMELERTVYSER